LSVPVFFGVLETFAYCYATEVVAFEGLEHVLCEIVHGLIHGIMLDVKPLVTSRTLPLNGTIPDLLRSTDSIGTIMQIPLSIQVKVRNMIT
jgi:hypothetical protein